MTTETLRKLMDARPFRPITLHMADGQTIRVEHPEFAMFSPSGRIFIVFTSDDGAEYIDLLLVVRATLDRNTRNGRRRAG